MNKVIFLLFFIFFTIIANAQNTFWTKTSWSGGNLNHLTVSNDTIYVVSGNQLRMTPDKGNTWLVLKTLGSGELITRVFISSNGNLIFGRGSASAGKQFYVKSAGSSTWDSTFDSGMGDLVTSFVQTTNGNIYAGIWAVAFGQPGVCVSTNNGQDWVKKGTSIGNVTSLLADGNTVYAGTRNGKLYKSTDNGDNWTEIEDFTSKQFNSMIKLGSDYYAGIGDELYKSTGNDDNWSKLSSFTVQDSIYSMFVATGSENFIYLGTKENEVWRSSNAGANWFKINSGLQDDKRVWAFGLLTNDTLVLGQDDGMYKSNFEASYNPPPPSAPTNLTATSDSLAIDLSWQDSQSGVTYSIYRKSSSAGAYPSTPLVTGLTTKSYRDNLSISQANTTFYYVVVAVHSVTGRNSSNSNEVSGKSTWAPPEPPEAPSNLSATAGNSRISLTWETVSGNNISYEVYRATSSNGYNFNSPLITGLKVNNYIDSSVTNEVRYYYVVKSFNDSTQMRSTRSSNEVSAIPRKPDPEPPSNLQVSVADPNVTLSWTASPTGDITFYRIYQSDVQGTGYMLIDSVPSNETQYVFTPQRNVTFYYVVAAWDGIHQSRYSNEVSALLENLELFIEVTPTSRYRVDQGYDVTYEINVKDQADNTDVFDLEIVNQVTGNTDNVQTNSNGYYKYEFQVPGDAVFSDYSISFTATKSGYLSATTSRDITVLGIPRESNDWAIIYKAGGVSQLIFAMADTNNKWFYSGIPGKLRSNGNDVVVNNFLKFTGDSVEVDTVSKRVTSWNGEWYVESPMKYTLFKGDNAMYFDYGSGSSITFTFENSLIDDVSKLGGLTLVPDYLTFTGGLLSSGFNLYGFFLLNGVLGDCDNPVPEIEFSGFNFTEEGINMMGATLPSLSPDPVACFNNLELNYLQSEDKLELTGDFSLSWLELKGYAFIQNGTMSNIELSTEQGASADIDATGMTLYGATGLVSGIDPPPMAMSLSGTMKSESDDLLEVDFDGFVEFPASIVFTGNEVRLFYISDFNSWQIVGPMNGSINTTSHLTMSGDINAGSIDGTNYVFEGNGNLNYYWNPEENITGGMTGQVTITDFPDQYPFDLIELFWTGNFPIVINNVIVFQRDRKIRGNIDFGGNIGVFNFTLDLNKTYGQEGFLEIGSGSINLNGAIRQKQWKKEQVQNFDPYKFEGQSLPLLIRKDDKSQAINANDTLNLTGGMDKVFIRIMSDTQIPGSTLIDPSGNEHKPGDIKDTNHIAFKQTANGKKAYWVIKGDFQEGNWVATTNENEAKPEDYRDVFATFNKRDIELSVSKENNDVTIEWNNTAVPDEPFIEFYLGLDTNDINGLYIGQTKEKDGIFTFTMTDSLPDCKYYIYVLRYDNDKVDRYYSTVELWNNKANLQTPTITNAIYYGGTKKLVAFWDDPNNPEDVKGYLIRIIYDDGTSEIIGRPYSGTNSIEIDIDIDLTKHPNFDIEIAAYNEQGWQSCWSNIQTVVVDVNEFPLAGFSNENDLLSIFPNPIKNLSNIRFIVPETNPVKITMFDILGNEILRLIDENYTPGIYDVKLNTEYIISGTYYIKYQIGNKVITKLVVISR